ncbi:MAG: zinc ABC transporter substrate-binding protein [Rhodospirillales bacterium]
MTTFKRAICAFLTVGALALGSAAPAAAQPKLEVVASFSVLADLAHEVGGDRITIRALVGPDSDAHAYQPTPVDARDLNRAQLLLVNGLGLEGWIERLVQASGFKGLRVVASTGIKPLTMAPEAGDKANAASRIADPHAWQSTANVMIYVDNIARGLSQADPDGAAYYAARANAYKKQLAELDAWVKSEIAMVPSNQRRVITTHDAFQYFASAYGVSFIAAEGISTESDPSAQHIAALIAQVRHEHVRALFIENMSDPRLIQQIARDGGAVLGGELYSDALSAAGGPADSYLKMFRNNVIQLKAGMLKN